MSWSDLSRTRTPTRVVVALLLLCSGAIAASDAPGPPTVEDLPHLGVGTAYLVRPGRLEIDLSYATGRHDGGRDRFGEIGLEVEVGLGKRWMLELEVLYADDERKGEAGLDEWEASAKTRLFARGSWAGALSFGVEGDASSGALAAPFAVLVGFAPAGGRNAWHLELGGEWEEEEGLEGPSVGLAIDRAITSDLALQLAFDGSLEDGELVGSAGPGLRAEIELERTSVDEIELVAGILAGVAGDAPDWSVVVGIELELR